LAFVQHLLKNKLNFTPSKRRQKTSKLFIANLTTQIGFNPISSLFDHRPVLLSCRLPLKNHLHSTGGGFICLRLINRGTGRRVHEKLIAATNEHVFADKGEIV
jgi:hypothetical protein